MAPAMSIRKAGRRDPPNGSAVQNVPREMRPERRRGAVAAGINLTPLVDPVSDGYLPMVHAKCA